jgi:hypothetical protein
MYLETTITNHNLVQEEIQSDTTIVLTREIRLAFCNIFTADYPCYNLTFCNIRLWKGFTFKHKNNIQIV